MGSNKAYGIGVLLLLFGGAGLEGIELTNHGCFWLCATMFSVGIALCLWSYKR